MTQRYMAALTRWMLAGLLVSLFGLDACDRVEPRDARAAVDRTGVELERLRAFVVATCREPAAMPAADCEAAQKAFNALQAVYETLRTVVP